MSAELAVIEVALDSAPATAALGGALASLLEPGDVVLLVGDLGAGKTTLVTGLAAALGSSTPATSPTFALCHLYPTSPPLAHVDCWRLDAIAEVVELGLDEVLEDGGVVVIEWGELAAPLFGEDALLVALAAGPSDTSARRGRLTTHGERWTSRRPRLLDALRRAKLAAAVQLEPDGEASR